MRLPELSRRHIALLGLAAFLVLLGALATMLTAGPDLDRAALAQLAGEAARGPLAARSLD